MYFQNQEQVQIWARARALEHAAAQREVKDAMAQDARQDAFYRAFIRGRIEDPELLGDLSEADCARLAALCAEAAPAR